MASIKSIIQTASIMALLGLNPAMAANHITRLVPNAQKVGSARMHVMIWDIYDADLYAPNGNWSAEKPYALQLTYLRNLDGQKIADRSIKEIREQGFNDETTLLSWQIRMKNIFPDVKQGDVLIGIYTSDKETVFYDAEKEIGRIQDPEFGEKFFGIWLNEKTSEPEIRTALLGNAPHKKEKVVYDVQNRENTIRYGGDRAHD